MVRTQVLLLKEQHKWLKHQAVQCGVSLSQLLRDIVDAHRGHLEKNQTQESRKKKALAIVGKFSSDGDTSR